MSAREEILASVARSLRTGGAFMSAAEHSPVPSRSHVDSSSRLAAFCDRVREGGGEIVRTRADRLDEALRAFVGAADRAAVRPYGRESTFETGELPEDPHELEGLDVFVCEATLGVAENGAVWLPESRLGQRAAPFLARRLVVVLREQVVAGDMHDAYERIRIDDEGFGIFIAGPSKTADIEQSLVVGAHGPAAHVVILVSDSQ
jgi:L-lactate dehydrogenase complex protein LldG